MNDEVVTLIATIRAREGREGRVESALAEVVRWVAEHEPQTLAYHVGREIEEPTVFTTFERFANESAMAAHNGSEAIARFLAAVADCLVAPIEIRVCRELHMAAAREAAGPEA